MLLQHDQNKKVKETKQLGRSELICFYKVRFKMNMMKRLLSTQGHTSMAFIVAKRVKQDWKYALSLGHNNHDHAP